MIKRLLLCILVAAACTRESRDVSVESMAPAAFESRITEKTVLLDVRTPAEFQTGFIAGAVNLDYKSENFEQKLDELDKSAEYLVYCASGVRSDKATDLMRQKGFKSIAILDGGIAAWAAEGRPLVVK